MVSRACALMLGPSRLGAALLGLVLMLLLAAPVEAQDNPIDISFGGRYRVRGFSLRNGTRPAQLDPLTRIALRNAGKTDVDGRQNFLDTRLRLSLTAARGTELALRTQFEIGDLVFGGSGANLGTDGVNIETKWLHLEWTPGALPLALRAGLYSETTSRALILSDDVAGLRAEYKPFGGDIILLAELIKAVDNSRVDLDNDGIVDNDFNDRTIYYVRADYTKLRPFLFGAYGMSEINNAGDTPVVTNVERDVYWAGGFFEGQAGPVSFSIDGVYAFGDVRNGANPGSVRLEGYAFDARVAAALPFITVETILGWGSGDDPSTTANEAFPTISTFYAHSNIIFDDYGGFNVTGSSISGVAHASVILTSAPIPELELKAIFVYATYTEDPRRATNVNRNRRSRDLGWEVGLNANWIVNENFKLVTKNGIFFPMTGYETTFDTTADDPLIEVIVGAEFNF